MRRLVSWWRLRRQTALGAAEAEIVTLTRALAERTDERDKARTAVAELTDALGREIARRVDAEANLVVKGSELRRAEVERTGGR